MNAPLTMADSRLGLWTNDHNAVPLEGVSVDVELALPLAVTRQTQRYLNVLNVSIEARYVFPVPLDAILLEMEIRIGDRLLHGVVKPKQEAEHKYESAIIAGDSAFLLTKLDDGLYQISLGNILPGEKVELTVTWGETLRWSGQEIRYSLPNLVGAHYGNPQRAGMAIEDSPTQSATIAYSLDIDVWLLGDLSKATVSTPNHHISSKTTADAQHIKLDHADWLDRRFTLIMHCPAPPALVAWSATDGEHLAVMACCCPPSPIPQKGPRHITLLVDCSGSMDGISIEQGRRAAMDIVQALDELDTCSLAAFGTSTKILTKTPLLAGKNRQKLLNFCSQLNADLGGTEMQSALQEVMNVTPVGGDILMITDGQVYSSDDDIRQFVKHQRRLFTIGVGYSTSEKILRQMSEMSGGFCELVSPNENMANHIINHFRRMRAPRMAPTYNWPGELLRENVPSVVFGGDTAIMSARLSCGADAILEVKLAHSKLTAPITPAQGRLATLLPRMVAAQLLPTNNVKQAKEEALHYQLVTEHTSMIAVLERDQSPDDVDLPLVIDVTQMQVYENRGHFDAVGFMNVECSSNNVYGIGVGALKQTIPAFFKRNSVFSSMDSDSSNEPSQDWLLRISARIEQGEALETMLDLATLPTAWRNALTPLLGKWPEEQLVLAVIITCLDSSQASILRRIRHLNRAVLSCRSSVPIPGNLLSQIVSLQATIPIN
ncbi:MAG: VWA domain-containing protein [Moraxellaceae bacterium]|nr:VWA domain-containing protein [Moraxellaceae bacterium]